MTARIPEDEREGDQQQSDGQLAPGNLGGRIVVMVGLLGESCRIFLLEAPGRRMGVLAGKILL